MGDAAVRYDEIRFVIKPDFTEVYVGMTALGDCPIGVQGWHYKVFPKDKSCVDIFNAMAGADSAMLWPQKAPDER